MSIDLTALPVQRTPISWNRRDVLLYALGIGASDLAFVYENHPDFQVLPTYPINIGFKGTSSDVTDFVAKVKERAIEIPGVKQNLKGMVAGDLTLEFLEKLPVHLANGVLESRTTGVWDGGKHMITDSVQVLYDASGKPLFRQSGCGFMLGGGGFGGPKRPLNPLDTLPKPSGPPTKSVEQQTDLRQAMIFRLTGDYNPHHVDPVVTKENGYDKPILHGPCTIGFATRHVAEAMCDNNPQKLKLIHCRFASPVVPGDVLRTEIWEITGSSVPFAEENKGKGLRTVQFRTCVGGREVVGNGVAVLE